MYTVSHSGSFVEANATVFDVSRVKSEVAHRHVVYYHDRLPI